jgi:hypothetical protein
MGKKEILLLGIPGALLFTSCLPGCGTQKLRTVWVQEKEGLEAQLKGSRDREQQDKLRQELEKVKQDFETHRNTHRLLLDASKQLGRKVIKTPAGKKALEGTKTWVERVAPLLEASEASAKVSSVVTTRY